MKFDIRDVEFVPFKGSGPGGQHRNKTMTCVRATHKPTGIVVRATGERSLDANKNAAIRELKGRIARLEEERRAAEVKQRHDAKPDAAFGHAIRTARMCGNAQGVVDHRTGASITIGEFSQGKIDALIEANLRTRQ